MTRPPPVQGRIESTVFYNGPSVVLSVAAYVAIVPRRPFTGLNGDEWRSFMAALREELAAVYHTEIAMRSRKIISWRRKSWTAA
jgi:hypothetical protein